MYSYPTDPYAGYGQPQQVQMSGYAAAPPGHAPEPHWQGHQYPPASQQPPSSDPSYGASGAAGMPPPSLNQMAAATGMSPTAMQAIYQQYAVRWAAMQRFGAPQQQDMGPSSHADYQSGAAVKALFWKTRMCYKWAQGACAHADSCRYAHGEAELRMPPPQGYASPQGRGVAAGPRPFLPMVPMLPKKTTMIEAMKKTKLCESFMGEGTCKYGLKCTFAHGEQELRPNDFAAQEKTKLCQEFTASGTCKYAEKCTFAHGPHELRVNPNATSISKPETHKTKLCSRYMQLGQCHYGARCTFAHGDAELAAPGAHVPAYFAAPAPQQPQAYPDSATGAGAKRPHLLDPMTDGNGMKRHQAEPEQEHPEPDCPLCRQLVHTGRKKILDIIMGLENPQAKKLGCMIMAATSRVDQLWGVCTPAMLLEMLSKTPVNVMDRIDVLKTVVFHVHEDVPNPQQELVDKYVDMGLPREVATFVSMVMDGKEGTASMSEYFHMLEVAKMLFGVNDDNYCAVSTAVGGIMMAM